MLAKRSDFPIVGEPLALDLVDTIVGSPDGDVDLFREPADLAAWLVLQAERLPQPDRALCAADLDAVRALRDHIVTAIEHARRRETPPVLALRALTDAQRSAPAYREVAWDGAAVTATTRRAGDYTARLIAHLAEAAADLLTSPSVTKVRECERQGCRLLFLPTHPRRRWCSTVCGNRVRVGRYYQRHKQG